MCLWDKVPLGADILKHGTRMHVAEINIIIQIRFPDNACLLYTSDAADDLLCVDLGGRRIIKKKKKTTKKHAPR